MLPGPLPPATPRAVERVPAPLAGVERLLVAVTTRAEALGLATVVRGLREEPGMNVRTLARSGGEIAAALALFDLEADHDLGRREARAALGASLPERVLVRGGSPGALAVARLAHRMGARVAHLGAGEHPDREDAPRAELQRQREILRLADLHLAFDADARARLVEAGVDAARVHCVGDPGADAMLELVGRVRGSSARQFEGDLGALLAGLIGPWLGRVVLVCARRRESLNETCEAVRMAAVRHPDWLIVWPLHGSARVQTSVHQRASNVANVVLAEPMPPTAFAWLLERCDVVLTDSRQLEAQSVALGRPVLVTRAPQEPTPLTAAVRPVGTRALGMLAGLERLLLDPALLEAISARATAPRLASTPAAIAALRATARPAQEVAA